MKVSLALAGLFVLSNLGSCGEALAQGQEQSQPDAVSARAARQAGQQRERRVDRDGRGRPIFGKISAIGSDSMEVTDPDGNKLSLMLTSSTEYRKDRQPAKLTDFKVGDAIVVRTEQADGKGTTAVMVGSGQFGMRSGQGRPGGGFGGAMSGTLGKDYVIGEVKAINPPQLTVTRTDNVSQTLELNEETSLRRGRDSITMADLQAGDHVIARGAVENNVFVPKNLTVFSAEQWKRMQEMRAGMERGAPPAPNSPAAPKAPSNPPNPPETQN